MRRLGLAVGLILWLVGMAQSATLLPNGKQQFINGNGVPLAGGSVYTYVPSTTTPKTTWQDSGASIANTNPIILDANGMATIYGTGTYREVVYDANSNLLFDALTSDGASGGGGGGSGSVLWCGSTTGSGNAQTCTNSSFTSSDGQTVYFYASYANTGSMTLTVSGQTYTVYKSQPSGQNVLVGGEVIAGTVNGATFSTISGHWQLITNNITSFGLANNIAGAATTNLGNVSTNVATITGTGASISSFGSTGVNTNTTYFVNFTGASNTIVYNSTTMVTPSGGNIIVYAGDTLIVTYAGGSNWVIQAVVRGKQSNVNSQTATSYTINATDMGQVVSFNTSVATAVTLPAATTAGFGPGATVWVKNRGTGVVTITPTTSTIDGLATWTLYPGWSVGLHSDGANYYSDDVQGQPFTAMTPQTASGTSVSFTGIPSWASRITISLSGVGFSIADNIQLQIGPVGGLETTGYSGMSGTIIGGTGATMTASGFTINGLGAGTGAASGTYVLVNTGGNVWVGQAILSFPSQTNINVTAGTKTLANPLSQLAVKGVGGNAFSGGTIEVYYE
jgi:hypothetical protein